MHSSNLIPMLALPGVLAFPWFDLSKRASTTDATLYAYGTNISGYPVVYSEASGDLYIPATNTTLAGLQSVTWDIPAITAAITETTTATMSNGTSAGGLHLDVTDTGVSLVTIASDATSGVTVYGQQLVYITSGSIEAKFWAKQVQFEGSSAYVLVWNQANVADADLTPVSLKTEAPAAVVS